MRFLPSEEEREEKGNGFLSRALKVVACCPSLLTTPVRGGERSFITAISQIIYKWKRRVEEYLPRIRLLINAKADI